MSEPRQHWIMDDNELAKRKQQAECYRKLMGVFSQYDWEVVPAIHRATVRKWMNDAEADIDRHNKAVEKFQPLFSQQKGVL